MGHRWFGESEDNSRDFPERTANLAAPNGLRYHIAPLPYKSEVFIQVVYLRLYLDYVGFACYHSG